MDNSPNFNFFNILVFSGVVYGLVFCIVHLRNRSLRSRTLLFLILTVLSLTLSNLQYWLIDIGVKKNFNIPNVVYIQFELLILPFFYLFVRSYLHKEISRKQLFLLFIPFVVGMIYQLIINLSGFQRAIVRSSNVYAEVITILYNITLLILIFLNVYRYRAESANERYPIANVKWLKHALFIGAALCLVWGVVTSIFYSNSENKYHLYYPLWLGISMVIYWVGHKGMMELRIAKERETIRHKLLRTSSKGIAPKTTLTENSKGALLFRQITETIVNTKHYLDPDLTLQHVADEFTISSGYLSQLINTYGGKSFTDFINEFRVEEAKRILCDATYSNYTISSIALESGFNTKSNFYHVFKKMTGTTPTAFKKSKVVQNL